MRSATMMPSSLPLCASMGPRTTSPTAQTFGAPVRQCSSTWMKPRCIELDSRTVRQQILRKGTPPHRDHQLVDLQRVLALRIRIGHIDRRARHGGARTLAPSLMSSPCFLKWRCASLAIA